MAQRLVKSSTKTVVRTAVQTRMRVAVKTLLVLGGAAAIAAAAAFVSVPQIPTYLFMSVASAPASSQYPFGTPNVPFLGLQLKTANYPVALNSITFTFLTDSDGSFTNGVANNIDPASAITDCTLVNNEDVRISSAVPLTLGQNTITFLSHYSLPPNTSGGIGVLCDLAPTSPAGVVPDALALTLASADDVAISSVTGSLPPEAIAMNAPLNVNGRDVTIFRQRPLTAGASSTSGQTVGLPPTTLTVTATPSNPSIFIVPGATKIEAARFQFAGPSGSLVHSLQFTSCQGSGCASNLISRARLAYQNAGGVRVVTAAVSAKKGIWSFSGLKINASPSATVSLLVDATGFDDTAVGSSLSFSLAANTALGLSTTPSEEHIIFAKSLPVVSLSPDSPSGSVARGMNEVLSFGLTANVDGPVDMDELAFEVTASDNAATGWLSCKNLGISSKWGLRDALQPNTRLEDPGDWVFYQADGMPCAGSPNGTLAYGVVEFSRSGDTQPKAIGAGQTATWFLRVDTSGADEGDVFQISLPSQSDTDAINLPGFAWTDTWSTKRFDGMGIPGLPLTGGTLTF